MSLEDRFNSSLIPALASREKQIQQTYRPVIGVHKWFARRPGTLFRGLLLSEFCDEPLSESFYKGHRFENKVIADPFMGGGTPLIEANRLTSTRLLIGQCAKRLHLLILMLSKPRLNV